MSVVATGATPPTSGPEGPLASQGNASTLVSPASNSTLPSCYVVNVNGTNSTNLTSSPPGVSLTNASLPSASFSQTNATNTTTVLSNSTAFCAPATPSASLTPTSGSSPRAVLDTSETTNSSVVPTTSQLHPISSSSSGVLVASSTPVPAPAHTTTSSQSSPTASEASTAPNVVTPSSSSVTVSQSPSPVAASPPASVTEFSTSLGTSISSQSTLTSTVTETPESTFSTPISITQTTDNHATITAPPFVTTTGLSTSPGGAVVTVTHVIANSPNQVVSGSSSGNSFFGNRAAVVGVFLASGFISAGLVLMAFCYFRRRQRRARLRGSRLSEISYPRPMQNPFAGVTGNPGMGERAGPNIRWHRSMLPRDPASIPQSLFSVPRNRSEDSLQAAHSAPVPPPPVQRAPSRSSYRVPVPHADVGVPDDDARVENRRSTGAFSEHLQTQIAPLSNAPPLLPVRSPLRLLAVHNIAKNALENRLSLSASRASSPSIYPSSPHRSDADSLYQEEAAASSPPKRESSGWLTRGLSYGPKSGEGHNVDRVDENAESQDALINPVDSDVTPSLTVSASSSSHAHYSPLESPASETGTAHTSIQDVNAHNRKVSLPRIPPAPLFMHRKSGARLRRDS